MIDVSDLPTQTPPTVTMTTTVVIDPPDDQMETQVGNYVIDTLGRKIVFRLVRCPDQ